MKLAYFLWAFFVSGIYFFTFDTDVATAYIIMAVTYGVMLIQDVWDKLIK